MVYGWWHFSKPALADLAFSVEILAGDERFPGRYFQLYQGHIGPIGFYLGFQSNLARPGRGSQGKGLIFSRWSTRDDADARAPSGGWVENAGHEGDFIGVRVGYDWQLRTRYECFLRPVGDDPIGRWYEFTVRQAGGTHEVSCGALRFPVVNGSAPLIQSGGGSWTEAYGGTGREEDVPETHFVIHEIASDSGACRPHHCDTAYSTFQSADGFLDNAKALHLRSGRGVVRHHAAGQYLL